MDGRRFILERRCGSTEMHPQESNNDMIAAGAGVTVMAPRPRRSAPDHPGPLGL
jgi:hypothetical protein